MSRIIRLLATYALAAAGVAGLVFLSACNVTSSSGGGAGRLNVLVTDAASDDWAIVQVQLKSISLHRADDQSWVPVWTEGTTPTTLNLVNLADVATILGTAPSIAAGSYDRLKLVINTDPQTMMLQDDGGTTYTYPNITVVDPGGKGEIKATIDPPITVVEGQTTNFQLDFDLAHPFSIIVQNGKVVINLQIRHKAVPRNLLSLQFARNIGYVTAVDTTSDPNNFLMTTLEGAQIKFVVDINTKYVDVATGAAGALANLPIDTTLAGTLGALVDSNMKSDGTFYARKVWYGTLTDLPQFTPEGLVRRVGDNWIKVLNKNADNSGGLRFSCHWDSDIIYVTDATVWTFQGTIPMGTAGNGLAVLQYIRRGFRVTVELVPDVTPKTAQSINVQSATDEGAIRAVTDTGFSFGGGDYCYGWNYGMNFEGYTHTWSYSTITDHLFSWWFYGLPSSSSTVVNDFKDTVTQARMAHLRVFARAVLFWDTTANSGAGGWVAENVILAPEKLPDPQRVTTAYTDTNADSGTMGVSTFDWDNETLPTVMTIQLDKTGELETIVGSLLWNATTRILTFSVPVPTDKWPTLLTPSLLGVRVWVRPVKNADLSWTWHAYSVIAFQITTN